MYLNVFTPRVIFRFDSSSSLTVLNAKLKMLKQYGDGISKTLLPVMVYIHGGFFMSGSANHYKPNYFMDHEVVMMTFNYRVGALGMLSC